MSLCSDVWEALHDDYDDHVRSVTCYHPADFETRYREDLGEMYTTGELQSIVDDVIVQQLGYERTDTELKTGDLHAIVQVYDDSWLVLWPDQLDGKSGFMISLQRGESGIDPTVLDDVVRYLNEDVAPRIS
ncbi:MAG: hypothetical protein ABEJ31_11745 [Haloarculaceae archaeon]